MGHQVRRDRVEQSDITDDVEKKVGKNRTKEDNAKVHYCFVLTLGEREEIMEIHSSTLCVAL
jgi:hypothetical protein